MTRRAERADGHLMRGQDSMNEPRGDWPPAVHEAAHAVVGIALGMKLRCLTVAPSAATLEARGVSRQALLATRAAGHLAERMLEGREADDAFDYSLRFFGSPLGLGVTPRRYARESPANRQVSSDRSGVESCPLLRGLRPCPFRWPSMASRRPPVADTPLHHKHRGHGRQRPSGNKTPAHEHNRP
jgi:hypothetical protein